MTNNIQQLSDVGVVIIGRNEGERLKKCIGSIIGFDLPVVYVDSNSSDDSVAYAKSKELYVVELDKNKTINSSVARNAGFNYLVKEHPNLEYIHFIDADCELDENWLPNAVEALEKDSELAVVCGRLREKDVNSSIYTRFCDMTWYVKPGYVSACGGIATIRQSVYAELSGFDESLIAGADPEFHHRVCLANYKILALENMMGTHDSAMTRFKQWWTRTTKTGFAIAHGVDLGRWQDRLKSVYIWSLIIPLVILLLSFINVFALVLFAIYPAQIFRISRRIDIPYSARDKLVYSYFCVLAKFPQLFGIIKFKYNKAKHTRSELIEYK